MNLPSILKSLIRLCATGAIARIRVLVRVRRIIHSAAHRARRPSRAVAVYVLWALAGIAWRDGVRRDLISFAVSGAS
jgi:hypothetical protein